MKLSRRSLLKLFGLAPAAAVAAQLPAPLVAAAAPAALPASAALLTGELVEDVAADLLADYVGRADAIIERDGVLYVGGQFTTISTNSPLKLSGIGYWRSSAWAGLDDSGEA